MTISSDVAVDVAILLPPVVAERARAVSLALAEGRPDALVLDDTHLPHITLAQQFTERARLDDLRQALDRLLHLEPPLLLRIPGFTADHGTVYFAIADQPDLQRVHEAVMDTIEPFELPRGGADAFRREGVPVRSQDVDWVRSYRERSAYGHFRPHVTLGHGAPPSPLPAIDFQADTIALCQLGRFCTCRAVLDRWSLSRA